MKTQPHPGAGIEISDVDLRSVDGETFGEIRRLFVQHGLVFFRDQELSEEDHIALAARFGTINVNRFFAQNQKHPEIALVAKDPGDRLNIGGGWHTDHSYDIEPAKGSILYAHEIPPVGGDTLFAGMGAAYEALSDGFKEMLSGLRGVHSSRHVFGAGAAGTDEFGSKKPGYI